MRNPKVNIYKATAAFLIILAAVFYYFEKIKVPEAVIDTIQVVVAAADIPENTIISKEMICLEKRYAEDVMRSGYIAKSYDEVVGKRTVVPLYKGELVHISRVIKNESYMNSKDQVQIAIAINEVDKALELKEGDYIDIWLEPISRVQDNQVIIEPYKIIEKIKIIKVHDSSYNSSRTAESITSAASVLVPAYITIELRDEVIKEIYEVDKSKYNIRITRYGEEKIYNIVGSIMQGGGD